MVTLTEAISNNNAAVVELKSVDNLGGQPINILKAYRESFRFEEQATIIKTKTIAGETMVWGNASFGVWGSSKWGTVSTAGFILGSSVAGVLGSSPLGFEETDYEDVRVIPPNKRFIDRYNSSVFIDSTSGFSISSGSLTIGGSSEVISKIIYKNDKTITYATPSYTKTSGDTPTIYMRCEEANPWEQLTTSVRHSFTTPGEVVRYKLKNDSTSDIILTKFEVQLE